MKKQLNSVVTSVGAITAVLLLLLAPSGVLAQGKKGAIYVSQHLGNKTIAENGAAVADVYIYQPDGTIVHSGKGTGSFKPGEAIELASGEYLVEIGRHRTRHNLQKYTVAPGQTTFVKTGWISVATWPIKDQPSGCNTWDARLSAMLLVNGQEHLVTTNNDLKPKEYSMVQLPVGTFRVYFNGLAVDVEVKEDTIYNLPLGTAGPYRSSQVVLATSKDVKSGMPSVTVCNNQPMHVLAGSWWRSETIKIDEHPYERKTWTQADIKTTDGGNYRDLPADKVRGHKRYRGAGSKPNELDSKEQASLSGYKEGALSKSIKGKFKGTTLDSLFEDSTDVQ